MDLSDLSRHFQVPDSGAFDVTPEAALEFWQSKGLKPTFAWQDMLGQEHAASFTVAKMMDVDLLKDVRESLDQALAEGIPFQEWADELIQTLQAKGWWGRKAMIDPVTGQTILAQLGSPARLQTIFRTNMQSAYMMGQWDQIAEQAEFAPYLMYDAIDDHRTRPEHAALDGKVLPIASEFWKSHTPPLGWNCRCSVIQLDEDDLESLGLEVSREPRISTYEWTNPRTGKTYYIPNGVDPGFGQAAASRIEKLQQLLKEKAANLPSDMIPAANQGIAATKASIEDQVGAAQKALAGSIGQGRLARSQEKVAQIAAEIEIQNAKAGKVPYLAKALADLVTSGKAAGMKPAELLGKAKELAAKAKQSAMLTGFKKSYLDGKTPSAAQQAAFDALPDTAKQDLLTVLDQQIAAAKAEAEAAAKLADIEANPKGQTLKNKVLADLKKAGGTAGKTSVQILEEVEAQAKAAQAKASAAAALSGYKAKILDGKLPTPAQKAAFDALTPEQQEAFLVKIEKEKAKQAPPEPEKAAIPPSVKAGEIDGANLTQIGPQAGSNPGGLFQDTTTGEKWYVKFPDSVDNARNEALTAALYRLVGIDSTEYRLVTINGREGIASRWVDGLVKDADALQSGKPTGIFDGFGADAWLANRDVIGQTYDNLKLLGNRAIRVDTGGGLRYRAQGGLKGEQFGDTVVEIDSMRDPRYNAQAASVFGKMTKAQLDDSVRRVLAVSDDDIRRAVDEWGPLDPKEREQLVARLLARKRDLYERFPGARPVTQPKPAPVADAGARVTKAEQKLIEDSRVNGYAVRTDKDQIEDQNVLVATYQRQSGGALTRGHLKLLQKGAAKLEAEIAKASGEASIVARVSDLDAPILELLKGINSRAAKGGAIEQKNIDRWDALKPRITKALADLAKARDMLGVTRKAVTEQVDILSEWAAKIEAAIGRKTATDIAQKVDGAWKLGQLKDISQAVKAEGGGVRWERVGGWETNLAEIGKGRATLLNQTQNVPGVSRVYKAEIDGVRIEYVPFDGNPNGRAFQGTLQIDVDGASPEASARIFATLERLGLNAERAGTLDRQELFLNRVARLNTVRTPAREAEYRKIDQIEDQTARVQAKLAYLAKLTGRDLEASDQWGTWEGVYQAFGHGRSYQYRPDLDDAEFNAFAKDHVLYNNPIGLGTDAGYGVWDRVKTALETGGQLSSLADRVRRGIQLRGSSVSADISTGGGNYVFTRIRHGNTASRYRGTGIYWKARQLRRMDAISYTGDRFGNSSDDTQRIDRQTTIEGWRSAATSSGNETIFKDGMSLFDDLDRIVLQTRAELDEALKWLRANGYERWPDGRALEDVLKVKG